MISHIQKRDDRRHFEQKFPVRLYEVRNISSEHRLKSETHSFDSSVATAVSAFKVRVTVKILYNSRTCLHQRIKRAKNTSSELNSKLQYLLTNL